MKGKYMDKFTKKQFHTWINGKIKFNPKVYGGDKSNPLIMKAYIQEFHYGEKAEQLADIVYSMLSTISRAKNKILKEHPEFDYRVRFAPKKRRAKVT